jgi:hypothetical protein
MKLLAYLRSLAFALFPRSRPQGEIEDDELLFWLDGQPKPANENDMNLRAVRR